MCVDTDECSPFLIWSENFSDQPTKMVFFASDSSADPPKEDPVGWFITSEGKLQYSNEAGTNYNGQTDGAAYLPKVTFEAGMSLTVTIAIDMDTTNPFVDYAYISILRCSGDQDLETCSAAFSDPDANEEAGAETTTLFMNLQEYVDAEGNPLPGGTEIDIDLDLGPYAETSGWIAFGFFSPNDADNVGAGFIIDDLAIIGPHPDNNCKASATCVNTEGAFDCVCDAGFVPDGEQGCADVNECAENPCQVNAVCENTQGGFECACDAGFEALGAECVDIDECIDQALFSADFSQMPDQMILINSDSSLDPPKEDPVGWFVSEDGKLRYANANGTNYNGANDGEAVLPKMTFKEGMTLSASLAIDMDETNPFPDYAYITITTCTGDHDWASCKAVLMDPDANDEDAQSILLFTNLSDYVDVDGNALPDGTVLDVDLDLSEYLWLLDNERRRQHRDRVHDR
jgi:hypothetical protein